MSLPSNGLVSPYVITPSLFSSVKTTGYKSLTEKTDASLALPFACSLLRPLSVSFAYSGPAMYFQTCIVVIDDEIL